jgi:DnaK suppressor protein
MPAKKKRPATKRKTVGAKKTAAKKAVAKKTRKTASTAAKKTTTRKKTTRAASKPTARKKTAKKTVKKKATVKKKPATRKATASKKKPAAAKKAAAKKKPAAKKKAVTKKKAAARKKPVAKKKPAAKKKAAAGKPAAAGKKTAARKKAPVKAAATKKTPARRRRGPSTAKRRAQLLTGPIHGVAPYKRGAGEIYMSDEQLEHFQNILLNWKRELMEEVDRTVHHMKDEAANFPDPNDRATQESEFGLELRTRDRERKLLRKIDSALARIDDGSYGFCEETGEEIGLKRLEARPVATLCLEAQERRELAERQFRDRDDRYR